MSGTGLPSGGPPRGQSGIPKTPVVRTGQGPYSTQGMISPMNDFVDPATGQLTPISFRFLWGLYSAIQQIEQRLTNAGIP